MEWHYSFIYMEKNLRQDDKSILDPVIWRINTTFWPSRGYSTDAGMVTILKKKKQNSKHSSSH